MKVVQKSIFINKIEISNSKPMVLIAGPCLLESKEHAIDMAGNIKEITDALDIPFIYKSSFDKANRTAISSHRGNSIEKAIDVFSELKKLFNNINILTDVHEVHQCGEIANYVDILQIPAFLSRQTDLVIAAAKTGLAVNIKKGQFMAPWDIKFPVEKVESVGNKNILICDRGSSFGYGTLVFDPRSTVIMSDLGYPVIVDATHAVQSAEMYSGKMGECRRFVSSIAKSGLASSPIGGLFMEVHEKPERAPSDSTNMLALKDLKSLLSQCKEIDNVQKKDL